MPMSTSEFIEAVLIHDVQKAQACGLHYISALVMGSGVEILGAILESGQYNLSTKDRVRDRFELSISTLFPRYTKLLNRRPSLYQGWRCGSAHQFRPQGYGFISRTEAEVTRLRHLDEREGVVVFVCEELFTDFAAACRQVQERIRTGKIRDAPFLWLPSDSGSVLGTGTHPTSTSFDSGRNPRGAVS